MERQELKGKQTPGVILVGATDTVYVNWRLRIDDDDRREVAVMSIDCPPEEELANAALYAEAHNVANRTGLWPLDMEQRIKELEEAAQKLNALIQKAQGIATSYVAPNGLSDEEFALNMVELLDGPEQRDAQWSFSALLNK